MYVKRASGKGLTVILTIMVVFTVGLILGAISIFYVPSDVMQEAQNAVKSSLDSMCTTPQLVKNNIAAELVWIGAIWIMGTLSIMAPFIAAVIAVRGFMIGFASAFVISSGSDGLQIFCTYILPQCALSLPVMTIFAVLCIRSCIERKSGEATDSKYFAIGIIFALLSFGISVLNGVITAAFIQLF